MDAEEMRDGDREFMAFEKRARERERGREVGRERKAGDQPPMF